MTWEHGARADVQSDLARGSFLLNQLDRDNGGRYRAIDFAECFFLVILSDRLGVS